MAESWANCQYRTMSGAEWMTRNLQVSASEEGVELRQLLGIAAETLGGLWAWS